MVLVEEVEEEDMGDLVHLVMGMVEGVDQAMLR